MRTSAAKSPKSHSTSVTRTSGFFKKSRSAGFFGPLMRSAQPEVQAKLKVSKPADPMEVEADRTADRVMRMSDEQVQRNRVGADSPEVQRAADEEQVQAKADAAPEIQRAAEEEQVQAKADAVPEVQRAAEEEQVQAKAEAPPEVQRKPAEEEHVQAKAEAPPEVQRAADAQSGAPEMQRAAAEGDTIQRTGGGAPTVAADAQTEIQQSTSGGTALPNEVRNDMEPRFGADLGDVRVHADEQSASLTNHLSARAFTYRNHLFFGRGQYQPGTDTGRRLLAHELTHTIQQGATVQRAAEPPGPAAAEVQRVPAVTSKGSPPAVQRLGVRDALDYFADKAHNIPGFRMLTLILGFNPINQRSVQRTAANFLRALIELVPGGAIITRALDAHGVINEAATWVGQKVAQLGDIGGQILGALRRFIDSLSWSDIFHLGDVWNRAKRIFTDPIGRLISFGTGVVTELLGIVKRVILRPLAALAEGTRGYDLLKALLGQDPITGDPFPRTADTLIGGFMKLIGQEEVWLNIKRGNAVARAYAWFQGALAGLMGFVRSIPTRVIQTLRSLTFLDVVTVVGAFRKLAGAFLGLAGQFVSWAGRQVLSLLEILFSVVAPGVMPYIAKARTAFTAILRNPIGFVGNLVRAGRLGFQKFARNILTHLKGALIKWLVGPLAQAGVYIPKSFSLLEIIRLVLSVLGLTWANIRTKLAKIIPEPVLVGLEKSAGILVTLATEGPAAAWEQVKGELTELKSQLISQVTEMIQLEVVKAAVAKLVSMINPAGAVVQAVIAIYNTITFFVERARQIGAVVASFVNSIAAIAAGRVTAAANRVEQTLASSLVVVIAFLAKFAGLGNIPEKLVGIVNKIRKPIDKALDKIVAWLGKMLAKLVSKAKTTAKRLLSWWKKKVPIAGGDKPHTLLFEGDRKAAKLMVRSDPVGPTAFMTKTAKDAEVKAADSAAPIGTTTTHETKILVLQKNLGKYDDNNAAAVSGEEATEADTMAGQLDTEMKGLGAHIGSTLMTWKVADPIITGLKIARGSFTVVQKRNIAAEAERMSPGTADLRVNSRGERINVRQTIARRHVVSASDMGRHYMAAINGKKASEAKLLIEERGSITDARTPVQLPLSVENLKQAAIARYRKFFGFAKNLFLGDSRENSSIQEHLDPKHPEMQGGNKLAEHVSRIKRSWAIDGSFQETPVKPS